MILIGGLKFKNQVFSLQGAKPALTVLVAISVLTLILPNFTTTVSGAYYRTKQLAFVVALILYVSFLFAQDPISSRVLRKNEIKQQITSIYFALKQRYGSPRITKELNCLGYQISRITVAKYMKILDL